MFKANVDNINSSHQELLSCCFCDRVSPNTNMLWLLLCYLHVRFQLASPPGFHFNTHPEGEPCISMYKCVFWDFGIFCSSGRGSFSCPRLRGTQGTRPDPARKFGPWPRSVARALGVQSGKSARGGIPST